MTTLGGSLNTGTAAQSIQRRKADTGYTENLLQVALAPYWQRYWAPTAHIDCFAALISQQAFCGPIAAYAFSDENQLLCATS